MSGRNVIITGSNRGIGFAMTKVFAQNGDNVWACARKKDEEFEKNIKEMSEEYGVWIKPAYFDLYDENEIKRGIKEILRDEKTIDVLINNAGTPHGGLMMMTPVSKIKEVYDINVFAQIQMMQLAGRRMMRQKSGCIINMCSVGGIEAYPGYIAYGSGKAALIWITRAVSKELAPYNIRVNGIAPGLVDTEMGNYKTDKEISKVFERMSIKRMGRPEEIAKAALYISSEDAAYMTGHIIVIDGGRLC